MPEHGSPPFTPMKAQTPREPRGGPPPGGGGQKLGPRDALAFILAAFLLVLPYVAIAVGLFVLVLLVSRLFV